MFLSCPRPCPILRPLKKWACEILFKKEGGSGTGAGTGAGTKEILPEVFDGEK
jgi:hypothetical protein